MHTELQKSENKAVTRKIAVAILAGLMLVGLAASIYFCYDVLTYDRIYKGVYVNERHVGGMLPTELTSMLQKEYQHKAENISIKLKCKNAYTIINLKDLNIKYNIAETVDRAYKIGREGNLLERGYEIFLTMRNHVYLTLRPNYSQSRLNKKIDYLFNKIFVRVKKADLIFQDSKERVILRTGHHGVSFDKLAVRRKVEEHIRALKGGVIRIKAIETPPGKLDVNEIYNKIVRNPANPVPVVKNNTVTITPPKKGRNINKLELSKIIDELKNKEDTERLLPVKFIQPALNIEDVSKMLFRDVLGSAVTSFRSNTSIDRNRIQNIRLAAAKINNFILGPGQVFSFNSAVGERTVAAGYKNAFIFENGKVVSGLGGGICQVSSTLYYSVLLADLEVLERINHMFAVSYIPLGVDAAVAYGSADFKFRNNTGWPVRLECMVTPDNKLVVKIIGTAVTPGKSVVITTRILRRIPYTENKIYDSNLPVGKTIVLQGGSPGYIVDTYKTVKINGKLITETKLHTSTYAPLTRYVKIGTRKN